MESLKELNAICQKPNYKTVGNWMVRNILRDAALPITWLLLHTRVTANQVTFASIVIGCLGAALLGCRSPLYFLWGTLLLQLWYLLDHVDGQIARYRNTVSLTGRFFDFFMHHLIHGIILFFLGFYVYRAKDENVFILWGFAATISIVMFNMFHDIKYKTFIEKIDQSSKVEVIKGENHSSDKKKKDANQGLAKRIFSLMHKACEMHVMMNILTFAALLQFFGGLMVDYRTNLFIVYAIIAPLIAIVKIAYLIKTRRIDADFEQKFKVS